MHNALSNTNMAFDTTKISALPQTVNPPASGDLIIVESEGRGTEVSPIGNLRFTSQNFEDGAISANKISSDIAGVGLTKTAGALNVRADNTSITALGGTVAVKENGITTNKLVDGAVTLAKINISNTDPVKASPISTDKLVLRDAADGATKTTTVESLASAIVGSLPGGAITADITLLVGAGQTYTTIQDALDFLKDKRIAPGCVVTIELISGVHNVSDTIYINHTDADNIIIKGQPLVTIPVAVGSTSASPAARQIVNSGGNNTNGYSVTLQLQEGGTTGLLVGDYIGVEFVNDTVNRFVPVGQWHTEGNNSNPFITMVDYFASEFDVGDVLMLHYGMTGAPAVKVKVIGKEAGDSPGRRLYIGDPNTGAPTSIAVITAASAHFENRNGGATVGIGGNYYDPYNRNFAYILRAGSANLAGTVAFSTNSKAHTWTPDTNSYSTDIRDIINVGDIINTGNCYVKVSSITGSTTFEGTVTYWSAATPNGKNSIATTNPACVNGCVRITNVDNINSRITVAYYTKFAASPFASWVDTQSDYTGGDATHNNYLNYGGKPFPSVGFSIRAWKFPTVVKSAVDVFKVSRVGLIKDLAAVHTAAETAYASNAFRFIDGTGNGAGEVVGAAAGMKTITDGVITLGNVATCGFVAVETSGNKIVRTTPNTSLWVSNSGWNGITLNGGLLELNGGCYVNGARGDAGVYCTSSKINVAEDSVGSLTVHGVYGAGVGTTVAFRGAGVRAERNSEIYITRNTTPYGNKPLHDEYNMYISHVCGFGVDVAIHSNLRAELSVISSCGDSLISTTHQSEAHLRGFVGGGVVGALSPCITVTESSYLVANYSVFGSSPSSLMRASGNSRLQSFASVMGATSKTSNENAITVSQSSTCDISRSAVIWCSNTGNSVSQPALIGCYDSGSSCWANGANIFNGKSCVVSAGNGAQVDLSGALLVQVPYAINAYNMSHVSAYGTYRLNVLSPFTLVACTRYNSGEPIVSCWNNSRVWFTSGQSFGNSSNTTPTPNVMANNGSMINS